MPVYSLNGFNLIEGEEVYVEDLLNCSDPGVYIRYAGVTGTNGSEQNVFYNEEENCFYSEKGQITVADPVKLSFEVCYDYDGDGVPEFIIPETVTKYLLDEYGSGADGRIAVGK